MDYSNIKELIKIVNDSKLVNFELKLNDFEIKMQKDSFNKSEKVTKDLKEDISIEKNDKNEYIEIKDEPLQEINQNIIESKKENLKEDIDVSFITSPMVGSFYDAPSPDSETFVKVGTKVKKGETVCIIEAMKLMNEIECDFDCEIVEVLVTNEEMVEYGQPLFKVRKL